VLLVERFVLGVDIEKFSARPARSQLALQRDLDRILDETAAFIGMDRGSWERTPGGDGETAVLPPDVDLVKLVRTFVADLDTRLTDHNDDHSPDTELRLRVAMHIDSLTPAPLGFAGSALIVLQRLLDSRPVRTALVRHPRSNLALIVSESLYQRAVLPQLGGLRPAQFTRMQVDMPEKDFSQPAYVYVPPGRPLVEHPRPPRSVQVHWPLIPPGTGGTPRRGGDGDQQRSADRAPPVFPFRLPRHPPRQPSQPSPPTPPPPRPAPAPAPRPEPTPAVQALLAKMRDALAGSDFERADELTTLTLLEAADRSHSVGLRLSDAEELPDELLTTLDRAWAEVNPGWGFAAQCARIDDELPAQRHTFLRLSLAFGWRRDQHATVSPYPAFARRASRGVPFYPTLRDPGREHENWYDTWSTTVLAVHTRLRSWARRAGPPEDS
jgi:hypothetical protein